MLYLATPVLVEQTLNMLVGLVDTGLSGKNLPGDKYMAAIGLMAYVLWLMPAMFSAVSIGATAMVSRFVGAGDREAAQRVTNQAFLTGAVFCIAGISLMFLFGEKFIGMMELKEDAAPLALRYLMIVVPVMPAMMIQVVGIACLRGAGDTISGFVTMTTVNLVNALTSYALLTGLGPLPKLGWDGLAIGTAVGYIVGATIILILLIRGRAGLKLRWKWLRFDRDLMRRLLRVGLPGGADIWSVLFCHLWYVRIINTLGTVEAAAHGLGVRIESLAYLPGAAFAVAATTLAGQFLGAQDHRRAQRSVLLALLVGGGIMTVAAICFYFRAEQLVWIFLAADKVETARATVPLMKIVAFSTPALAVAMILTGALRGAGDTRWPLVFTIVGFLGIRIPLAYVLAWESVHLPLFDITVPGFGWGVEGAWWAMVVETVLRATFVATRFFQGGWKRIKV